MGQTRQVLTQPMALLLAPGMQFTGRLIRGLLLLPPSLKEAFGARFSLASRLVALDDLRLDLDRFGAGTRSRIEMHISLRINPAVDLGSRQR